jgi:hypothetical protein
MTHPTATGGEAADHQREVRRRLDAARRELLDLSGRNRLLNTPRRRTRSRSIEIVHERAVEVFRRLVIEGKSMMFEPAAEPDSTAGTTDGSDAQPIHAEIPAAESEFSGEIARDPRLTDDKLQTDLLPKDLQNRLLRTYYDARTYQEEHGINTLYLALGFLKWTEPDANNAERHAPLLLIPIELERASARSRFRARWTGEELSSNLSLHTKLKVAFGLELPDIDHGSDDELDPEGYFLKVREVVAQNSPWEVLSDDIVVGFFSFAKLLMYRDLDPENWPQQRRIDHHELIGELLGAPANPPRNATTGLIDGEQALRPPIHVVDADSSQSVVIDDARRGQNLVIQGPPGTGKSQTIANLIGAAVRDGKRVLFVAEKLAALSVVKARLDHIGLGDMCLELHSNKVKKAAVLDDLRRTLELDRPQLGDFEGAIRRLSEVTRQLDAHVAALHGVLEPYGLTAYEIIGQLVRLRDRDVAPADFPLDTALTWTPQQRERRSAMIEELAGAVEELGQPDRHPWRGCKLESILPGDLQRLMDQASTALASSTALKRDRDELGANLGISPQTFGQIRSAAAMALHMADAPALDPRALANDVWRDERVRIGQLVEAGESLQRARSTLQGVVSEAAWSTDVRVARRDLAAFGRSWLRFLRRDYRRAKAMLRGILTGQMPRRLDERLAILDALIGEQQSRHTIAAHDLLGRQAFGTHWLGAESPWSELAAIESWDRTGQAMSSDWARVRTSEAMRTDVAQLKNDAIQLQQQLEECSDRVAALFAAVKLDLNEAFDRPADSGALNTMDDVSLDLAHERIEAWREEPESLSRWIRYRQLADAAKAERLTELIARLHDGRIKAAEAVDRLDVAMFEAYMRDAGRRHPALASFDGASHDRLRAQFRQLDQQFIELSRQQVAAAHYESIPRGAGQIGEVGIIRHELNKRRRHLPIRQLLQRAGNAVAAIKPVFMMSPLSVAKYLEPGAFEFDLLLIDEASQVMPVDAFGAIARARQIVVVGDDKQLPPTRFFTKLLEESEFDEIGADESYAGDVESILGLCASHGLDQRMLRWHYRSRHHSLIAVSNREFYDERLLVIPSPRERDQEFGLQYRSIEGSAFDRGGSATNRVEALAVAQAVMDHARDSGELTLGVGAFSIHQRDAIIDELERLRRESPDLEPFFAPGNAEPFFVKNLENIQGDERDVIFISVGYGPDKDGRVSMNFGPLSAAGGERRLNVLITRAKTRCVVFTALAAEDIDLERATGRGPQAFKAFLEYAQCGRLPSVDASPGAMASAVEQSVADTIREAGEVVDARIGVAGFFIDLAVRERHQPGRYRLGIECDGPSFAAASSARDRERSRADVLKSRGWRLHQVWSLDWFLRPTEQRGRLLNAIRDPGDGGSRAGAPAGAAATISQSPPVIAREGESVERGGESRSTPYIEAKFKVPTRAEPQELSPPAMAEVVAAIVAVEGPVHVDEIAARVRTLWRLSRLTPRTIEAIQRGIDEAARTRRIHRQDDFCLVAADAAIRVRDRSKVSSSGLRSVELLPPMEVQQCLKDLIADHLGATREEAIVGASRQLGFRSTTAPLREFIDAQIDALLYRGDLRAEGDRLATADGARA